jgi:hypothetical protein
MGGSQNKTIKKHIKEICKITPFDEMNNAQGNINKITEVINSNNKNENKAFDLNKNLNTEKNEIDFQNNLNEQINQNSNIITFEKIAQNIEKLFTVDEKYELDNIFLIYSVNGIMSNRNFWKFLNLGNIYNTEFAKIFYKAACDFNDIKIGHLNFMDKYKFMQFVAIFTKNKELNENKNLFIEEEELDDEIDDFSTYVKLRFLFSLFDSDYNEEITKLEFYNLLSSFLEMVLLCKFDFEPIKEQINNILNLNVSSGTNNISQLVEKFLEIYVNEIFSNKKTFTFEDWKKWLLENINGINEIFSFSGTIINNSINQEN